MTVLREKDKQLKADLLKSAQTLADGSSHLALRHVLEQLRPGTGFALVVNWIPEQGEDIYWLLVSPKEILVVEVPREECDGSASLESVDVEEIRKRKLSVETRRRLFAALEIMSD